MTAPLDVDALLLDIDGVLVTSWQALPGSVEAVAALRRGDVPFRLLTNTTTHTRLGLAATLREAGFSQDLVYHAFHILEAHTVGFTVMQLSFPYQGEELAGMANMFLEQLGADEYPDLVDHVRQHLEPHEGESGFEIGLDLLLDGLEREL